MDVCTGSIRVYVIPTMQHGHHCAKSNLITVPWSTPILFDHPPPLSTPSITSPILARPPANTNWYISLCDLFLCHTHSLNIFPLTNLSPISVTPDSCLNCRFYTGTFDCPPYDVWGNSPTDGRQSFKGPWAICICLHNPMTQSNMGLDQSPTGNTTGLAHHPCCAENQVRNSRRCWFAWRTCASTIYHSVAGIDTSTTMEFNTTCMMLKARRSVFNRQFIMSESDRMIMDQPLESKVCARSYRMKASRYIDGSCY